LSKVTSDEDADSRIDSLEFTSGNRKGITHLMADIAKRFDRNPLLQPEAVPPSSGGMEIVCLLNPGAFRYQDKTWLLVRVAERPTPKPEITAVTVCDASAGSRIMEFGNNDPKLDRSDPRVISYDGHHYLSTMSHLRLFSSRDGAAFSEPAKGGMIFGEGELETFGIEDCRVALIEGTYFLTYTQVSEHGVGVGLKSTLDWKAFRNHGMIFAPHNKDCAFFEEKIGGMYYAMHRPSSPELGGNYLWIAESPDLKHWGNHRCIAHTRENSWDSKRLGAGASPIKTGRGWLEIYHGANDENRYCLGAILLDLHEPWRVIARSDEPIMEPHMQYERVGFFGEVIFTNGHVIDGDTLTVYYGASDEVVCAATFSIQQILNSLPGQEGGNE
jgi:beta-1,2-mannobiose phosphorylase / 1,2-beta-oligomannan phosphorylase